jgi:hypothetical protein
MGKVGKYMKGKNGVFISSDEGVKWRKVLRE